MNAETWRQIRGFGGRYEASDHGRARVDGDRMVALTPTNGYRIVKLAHAGETKRVMVHRLVLEAFVGPPEVGTETCHGDGNRANNHVANLRWDTRSENAYDRVRHGTHNNASKTKCKQGHALVGANLAPSSLKKGLRECLACQRERGLARSRHREFSSARADERFDQIMAQAGIGV